RRAGGVLLVIAVVQRAFERRPVARNVQPKWDDHAVHRDRRIPSAIDRSGRVRPTNRRPHTNYRGREAKNTSGYFHGMLLLCATIECHSSGNPRFVARKISRIALRSCPLNLAKSAL